MSPNGELFMNRVGAKGMLADDAAFDDGLWEIAFLNQWTSRLGRGIDDIQRNSQPSAYSVSHESRSDKDQRLSETRRADLFRPGATSEE
jgi:hypothetical protein